MGRTAKTTKKKRGADDDYLPTVSTKKRKSDGSIKKAPGSSRRGKGKAIVQEDDANDDDSDDDDGETEKASQEMGNESQAGTDRMKGLQQQLIKMQSIRYAALKSYLAKFKEQVHEREEKTIEELMRRMNKRRETRAAFIATISPILQESSPNNFSVAFNSYHKSAKSASLQLLRMTATFQSSMKEIVEKDMVIGNSWNQEIRDAKGEIKSMSDKTRADLERFFRSKEGGWKKLVHVWQKKIRKLLENEDGGEQ